jgi:hypothetical protein
MYMTDVRAQVGPEGASRCLPPSITVKQAGDVLTLEEKFQSGTGVNLTPPPPSLVPEARARSERRMRARPSGDCALVRLCMHACVCVFQ